MCAAPHWMSRDQWQKRMHSQIMGDIRCCSAHHEDENRIWWVCPQSIHFLQEQFNLHIWTRFDCSWVACRSLLVFSDKRVAQVSEAHKLLVAWCTASSQSKSSPNSNFVKNCHEREPVSVLWGKTVTSANKKSQAWAGQKGQSRKIYLR